MKIYKPQLFVTGNFDAMQI